VWNDFEFYNLVGFSVYFNDDAMEKVVHIQAWTLGIGETVSKRVANFAISPLPIIRSFSAGPIPCVARYKTSGCKLTFYHPDNHPELSFCEIHYCLSNGGGSGGMVRLFYSPLPSSLQLTSVIKALLPRRLHRV
jgi:hypothetical protein